MSQDEHETDAVPANSIDRPGAAIMLGWGLLGFLVGAVFWHFIGFWGFISDVVLRGHPDDIRIIAQVGPECTEMVLDRTTGAVTATACPASAPVLVENIRSERQDSARLGLPRSLATSRWSIHVLQDDDESKSGDN